MVHVRIEIKVRRIVGENAHPLGRSKARCEENRPVRLPCELQVKRWTDLWLQLVCSFCPELQRDPVSGIVPLYPLWSESLNVDGGSLGLDPLQLRMGSAQLTLVAGAELCQLITRGCGPTW